MRAAGADGPECAICMGPVNAVTGEFMVTPCDHMFHEICLRQWMDLKMECPVCRAALPPTPNDGRGGLGIRAGRARHGRVRTAAASARPPEPG